MSRLREVNALKAFNAQRIGSAFAAAALDSSLWGDAMETIARETRSFGAMLWPVSGALPGAPITESMRPSLETYFRDGWHLRDERRRAIPAMIKRGVADDFDYTTPDEMKRHPYFQELLRPLGLQHLGLVKIATGGELWCIPIQRSPGQGPFSANEKRELADLSLQLSSAAAVARALGFAAANAASEAFETTGSAVALLNSRGEVLRLNRVAQSLIDSELGIVNKRITSTDRRATEALNRALHALLWTPTWAALRPPVVLPRRSGRPVLAYLLKLSTISANVFSECQAVVVLIDLEKRVRPPQDEMRLSFGLTGAEARLAACIASGATLDSISDELRISKETARNELKAIFQKTGVHRQSELVSVLASFLRTPPQQERH
jgi:DNA-binding CsgD family transcriptional regulator